MRCTPAVTLPLLGLTLLTGCSAVDHDVLGTWEAQATPEAPLAIDGEHTATSLAAAAGTFTRTSTVTLTERATPVAWARGHGEPHGVRVSPREVTIELATGHLASDARLELTVPAPGYDPLGSMVMLAHHDGAPLPLQHVGPAADGRLKVEVTRADLDALVGSAAWSTEPTSTFSLFTADLPDADPEAGFAPGLFEYQPGFRPNPEKPHDGYPDWKPVRSCADHPLSGRRVAFLVHGLLGNPTSWRCVAPWLAGEMKDADGEPYYEKIWAFGYESTAPLDEIGTALADFAAPCFRGVPPAEGHEEVPPVAGVDLFAHSMGNPISRYAMETADLENRLSTEWIHHYVSFAGVHEGVPARLLQGLIWRLLGPLSHAKPATRDLLTDFIPRVGDFPSSWPNHFLRELDANLSPDAADACYYTLGGTDSNLVMDHLNLGMITNALYKVMNLMPRNLIHQDGLVAQYCSQATDGVLDTKSEFYAGNDQATTMVDLTHLGIVGLDGASCLARDDPNFSRVLETVGGWIEGWIAHPSPRCLKPEDV